MIDFNFNCILDNKMKKILLKNPHTIQYFCNVSNITNNNNNTKHNFIYKYYKSFIPPKLAENIFTDHLNVKKYKKKKLPITLSDIPYTSTYIGSKQLPRTTIHWGQMKLFLSTLHFLLNYCPKMKKVNILYVGSAEGYNIPILVNMFPNTFWYLIDPRDKYDKRLYKMKRVKKIIIDYFTNDMAHQMKNKLKKHLLLFITDIRTVSGEMIKEEDIDIDMKLQLEWYYILNPDYSQFKFRIQKDYYILFNFLQKN